MDPEGKVALFSGQPRGSGRFQIECSSCQSHTRSGARTLARLAFPVNFTVPFKYHHTWLKCPSCGQRTWVRIRSVG